MIELALDELLNAEVATLDALLDAELWLKIQHTVVRIPDEYSRYANFKHRLWFIWYIWYIAQLQLESGKRLPWSAVVHGADANGDLWLWEDEDEKCIKEFAEDLTYVPEMPMEYWDDACRALEARQLRTTELASPLSHLTPKTRLRFIAWLIVAGPVRMNQILQEGDFRLGISITRWDRAISDSPHNANSDAETCKCRVLRIWFETMLEVYLLEDLQSTPWYHTCNCFHSQLGSSTHSRQRNIPEKPLCKDSVTLRVLYELIVPPWLLLHWVIFRMAGNVQANCVQTFLDILNGEHNLFDWDDNDNSDLYRVLVRKDGSLGLYPRHWTRYMVEIDLQTWQQLSNKTRTANKNRPGYEMRIRLTAMLLIYSSTPITFQKLLGPLASDPIFDNFPFATMARVADKHYKRRATADDFQLDDFGATPNLQNWLLAWSETLCHDIWCTSPTSFTALERVQAMHLNLTKQFPQNLCMYAHSLMHRWPGHSNGNIDIFFDRSFEVLRSIKSYYFDVEVLLSLLKQSVEVLA
ncbi:hypothetical protein B0H19DRAFT_474537 [Mycena capillaripes]|nr:hypothetical protein B0H19DRAFT_474537 [Mycena capillaripes]